MIFAEVLRQARLNRDARRYPAATDERSRLGTVFPVVRPKFTIDFSAETTMFTIGSCFARNIEEALMGTGVQFPTRDFTAPREEWATRPNGLLNEYNPGSIAQRILAAIERRPLSEATIYPAKGGLFLNRMPPSAPRESPDRFVFRRLGVEDCLRVLRPALEAAGQVGLKTILTVSPVPIGATFAASDCVTANEYSKSVLRVVAEELSDLPLVDYFPSYEIVRGGGMTSYIEDQIHVRGPLVSQIMDYLVSVYKPT